MNQSTDTSQLTAACQGIVAEAACIAAGLIPTGFERVDAHAHLGVDTDGSSITPEQLAEQLDHGAIDRTVVAPLHFDGEYDEANRQLLQWSSEHDGRFLPLWRCNPHRRDARADALRGIGEGAIGIKLHPRAEQFGMLDPGVRAVCEVAHEASAMVLIHAGRGMPALGEGVLTLARELPDATFVMAHAAISDLSWIVAASRDLPNLVFDTSWWRPLDLAALMAVVPPSRVLYGSDPPYGTVPLGVVLTARVARAMGYTDTQMAGLFGGNVRRAVGEAVDASAAALDAEWSPCSGLPYELPWPLRRASEYLATGLMVGFYGGQVDESIELAQHALAVPASDEIAPFASKLATDIATCRAAFAAGVEQNLAIRTAIVLLTQLLTPQLALTGTPLETV